MGTTRTRASALRNPCLPRRDERCAAGCARSRGNPTFSSNFTGKTSGKTEIQTKKPPQGNTDSKARQECLLLWVVATSIVYNIVTRSASVAQLGGVKESVAVCVFHLVLRRASSPAAAPTAAVTYFVLGPFITSASSCASAATSTTSSTISAASAAASSASAASSGGRRFRVRRRRGVASRGSFH